MSEPLHPRKEGGLTSPPKPQPSDDGLTQTGAGETRQPGGDDDGELAEEGAAERPGGMIGEG